MHKLKIFIVNETYLPNISGVVRFSQELSKYLIKAGHHVAIMAPSTSIKDEIQNSNGLTIFRMKSVSAKGFHPNFRIVSPLNINKKAAEIIQNFKPDIIHIQNHFTLGKACLKAAKKMQIPIIGTSHFVPDNILEYIPLPGILADRTNNLMWKDFVKVYNQLDCVTSPTFAAKALIEKVGLKNKITVISNGIDLSKFKPIKISDENFNKYSLNKNLPIFIFVGRLDPDKNVDLILKATSLAVQKQKIQVVIVGNGKDEKKLKEMYRTLNLEDKVFFTGRVSDADLQILLNLADVAVASGSIELQCISVMEAMAMNLPILALSAIALPELVKDGVNGFLFEFNANDLADKMLKIIADKNKLQEMSRQSYTLIQKHSQPEVMKKFEKLYFDVILTQK